MSHEGRAALVVFGFLYYLSILTLLLQLKCSKRQGPAVQPEDFYFFQRFLLLLTGQQSPVL